MVGWEPDSNLTDNVTSFPLSPGAEKEMTTGDYFMLVGYLVICICGLVGNAISMAVVIYNNNMKTMSNIFIFNLALTDFLFLLSLPFTASVLVVGKWMLGKAMCKIHYMLYGINVYAGVYMLALMSADRYVAVCRNEWHCYRTIPNSVICCGLVWLAAILLMMPLLLYSSYDVATQSCFLNWPTYGANAENDSAPAFAIYTLLLGFAIPVVIICIFYALIIARLRNHERKTKHLNTHLKRTKHITMLVLAIILAYLFCWTPYWIIQIYLLAKGKHGLISQATLVAYHCTTMLYHVNNALNPVLYGFLSSNFRKGAKAMFRCTKDSSIRTTTNHATSKASHFTRQANNDNGHTKHTDQIDGPEKLSLMPSTVSLTPRTPITQSVFHNRNQLYDDCYEDILTETT